MERNRQSRAHRLIAEALCDAAEQLLRKQAPRSMRARDRRSASISTRVGTGKATYCRQAGESFTLTFGIRMIAEKCNASTAVRWLSATEITRRGYLGGRLTPANLLAHTVCHEVSHVVQCLKGWRLQHSVHNDAFYRILDRMHERGWGEHARDLIEQRLQRTAIRLPTEAFAGHEDQLRVARARFSVGDAVQFALGRSARMHGTILRLNPKRAVVVPLPALGCRPGVQYRVPYGLLMPCRRQAASA